MKIILQWVLFLPAAALAAAIASMAVQLAGYMTMGRYDADPHNLFVTLSQGAVMGIVFVAVGRHVAPLHRPWVPWMLAALTAVFVGLIMVPAYGAGKWIDLASSFLMVTTAFATAWRLAQQVPKSQN